MENTPEARVHVELPGAEGAGNHAYLGICRSSAVSHGAPGPGQGWEEDHSPPRLSRPLGHAPWTTKWETSPSSHQQPPDPREAGLCRARSEGHAPSQRREHVFSPTSSEALLTLSASSPPWTTEIIAENGQLTKGHRRLRVLPWDQPLGGGQQQRRGPPAPYQSADSHPAGLLGPQPG